MKVRDEKHKQEIKQTDKKNTLTGDGKVSAVRVRVRRRHAHTETVNPPEMDWKE